MLGPQIVVLSALGSMVAFVTTSPRGADGGVCEAQLVRVAAQIRRFTTAPIVLSADGRNPTVTAADWRHYNAALDRTGHLFDVVVRHPTYLHAANGLAAAIAAYNGSVSLLFVTQDDLDLLIDHVDYRYIRSALRQPDVQYVKLWNQKVPPVPAMHAVTGYRHATMPCLTETSWWSDRPHFATKAHYDCHVWPNIGPATRKTVEQVIERKFGDRGLWIYSCVDHVQTERIAACNDHKSIRA